LAAVTVQIRRDDQIHSEEGGWFHARWHFSFDKYRDPQQMGFGPLRVFNDDRLEPGAAWPLHPHRDIEGITYVVEGTFEHSDSLGNGGQLPPGSIQRATLGSGMWHSERNGSATEPMRFLQFWILPDTANLEPSVQQQSFTEEERHNRLLRVAGPSVDDPVLIHQDASVHVGLIDPETEVTHALDEERGAYVYLIRGAGLFDMDAVEMAAAARVFDQPTFRFRATWRSELILIDLPMRWTPVGVWAGLADR